ncbi:MAG: hypothetical protein GY940_04520, partial [bacterium]|nr:hypothetical protein [bacterium]
MKKVLDYWRNSLADANRMTIAPARLKKAHYIENKIEQGTLPEPYVGKLFEEKKDLLKRHLKKEKEDIPIKKVEILISPIRLVNRVEHGKEKFAEKTPGGIHPIWVPAVLKESGTL